MAKLVTFPPLFHHHLMQYMELLKQIVDSYLLNFIYGQQSLVHFY